MMLFTKHLDSKRMIKSRSGQEKEKPETVIEYNNCKAFIDFSGRKKAYNCTLRSGIKWYRKLTLELLLGTVFFNVRIEQNPEE